MQVHIGQEAKSVRPGRSKRTCLICFGKVIDCICDLSGDFMMVGMGSMSPYGHLYFVTVCLLTTPLHTGTFIQCSCFDMFYYIYTTEGSEGFLFLCLIYSTDRCTIDSYMH